MSKKCECGLLYVPGLPEDEILHQKHHAEYLHGPKIESVRKLSRIANIDSYSIHVVDRTCSPSTRRELAYVASVAKRSMPEYPSGFDGTINEDDQRLYIAVDGIRIVAMVITALDNFFWQCRWNEEGSLKLLKQNPKKDRNYVVARVWTAPSEQGKGLASQMVQLVSDHLPCKIADLGWELPLSKAGEKLLKRFYPDTLWGCGDIISLQKYL